MLKHRVGPQRTSHMSILRKELNIRKTNAMYQFLQRDGQIYEDPMNDHRDLTKKLLIFPSDALRQCLKLSMDKSCDKESK